VCARCGEDLRARRYNKQVNVLFNKQQKLTELGIHQRKLSDLVSELLKRADEIDRQSQQRQSILTADWHESFANTCQEIVSLSQTVDAIGSLVKKGDVKGSEKAMLRSADVARHLWSKLQEFSAPMK
jgi:hypothetical protein